MGWLFTEGQSRREVIHARLHRQWGEGYSGSCLAHALRGNVLWSVWELVSMPVENSPLFRSKIPQPSPGGGLHIRLVNGKYKPAGEAEAGNAGVQPAKE